MKKPKLNIFDPTGWVGLDRYREAMAEYEAEMHNVMPERFKGLTSAQAYDLLKKETEQ
jgi:hypothetical protein